MDSFNVTLAEISRLGEERTEVTRRIEEARASGNPIAILNVKHDADIISLKIEDLKEKAHVYREELRKFTLKGVPLADGTTLFYPASGNPGRRCG